IWPFCAGDSAILMIVPWYSAVEFSIAIGPPASLSFAGSLVVRSWLICSHVLPKSGLLKRTFPARYTVVLSCGENTIGEFQLKRYFWPSAGPPPLPRPHGFIDCCSRERMSVQTISPPCDSERYSSGLSGLLMT